MRISGVLAEIFQRATLSWAASEPKRSEGPKNTAAVFHPVNGYVIFGIAPAKEISVAEWPAAICEF